MEYGCIGEHLPHSFSKEIHEKIGSYRYELKELTRAELPTFMEARPFRAINVTIPYKEAVIPFLHWISPEAAQIGAVNTVVNRGGLLYGYNTDAMGLTALLERGGIDVAGKKVLILGTGGTSKTALAVCKKGGAKETIRVSRSAREGAATYEEALTLHADAEVIVNTTPCGMYPDLFDCPLDPERFPALMGVADAIYNPLQTRLVARARAAGARAVNGLYMLVCQAVAAYEICMDAKAPPQLSQSIFLSLYREKQNIVLIGMPGSGKSTVGALLAKKTGREFVDTDDLIRAKAGCEIAEIFAEKGEAAFREMEREVIRQLAGASGLVIATGGGVVLNRENTNDLRMNGRLYFLNRPPAYLVPTSDRPLASTKEAIAARYRERFFLYLGAADHVIAVENDAAAAAAQIELLHFSPAANDRSGIQTEERSET